MSSKNPKAFCPSVTLDFILPNIVLFDKGISLSVFCLNNPQCSLYTSKNAITLFYKEIKIFDELPRTVLT